MKNDFGVIQELGGWTHPGSSTIFKTEEEAINDYANAGKTRRHQYNKAIARLKNMKISYDDIYAGGQSHGFINEIKDYDDDSSGGGFYQAFAHIWTDGTSPTGNYHTSYRTLGWLFAHRYDPDMPGVRNLVKSLIIENSPDKDPVLAYALQTLDTFSDEYWITELDEYEED
jgi:hypothetical protein